MKIGDLVKHIHFGMGLIYQKSPVTPDEFHYWKAVEIYSTQDIVKVHWMQPYARTYRDFWVAEQHLEMLSECG